jgi:succinyl-diaminopimelate desuccinylase
VGDAGVSAIPDKVLERIDNRVDEMVSLTCDLIRFPTINPPGEAYRPCAEYIGTRLEKRGFDVEYVRGEGTPGDSEAYPRVNVIARREGSRPGPSVHFNGHIDVVEVGSGWTVAPFDAVVSGDRIYGRGACDMKGGLAAAIIAVEALIDTDPDYPGTIEVSGTVDEESGGFGGVAYLAERGWFSAPRVDHVIIPEPLNVNRVCVGHRGVWWAEIETHGRMAHGSMPFLGDSAIRHMAAVLDMFEKDLYPKLAERLSDMPVVPDGARQSTMNINSVHGGQTEGHGGLPAPCVADSCRMIIDRRFLIEESLADVREEITGMLDDLADNRPEFRFDIREMFAVEPCMSDRDGPVASTTAAAIRDVLGVEPDIVCSPGTYDQKHVDRIGKLKDCIAYGPGLLDLAHQPDEWVGIEDMTSAAKVMAVTASRLLRHKA